MLSVATDYIKDAGDPGPYLRNIAEAGFSHIHWCHEWNTDYLYSKKSVGRIKRCMKAVGLKLLDLHASAGNKKNWGSAKDQVRCAGVELVRNRIAMAAELGADVIVLHVAAKHARDSRERFFGHLCRSLDELRPFSRAHGVRIAIENMDKDNFVLIKKLFSEFEPDFLGLCYDSGHGNIDGRGLDLLKTVKSRLIALHLHDNNGKSDQHKIPFTGTIDWDRLAGIIRSSGYKKCPNLELRMASHGAVDEKVFLNKAFEAGRRLSGMIKR
jgi:sugar phosphate isomerase/epimerase